MTYDSQRHQRCSTRLRGYDYAQEGAYFITACAYQRETLFGEIIMQQMMTNGVGQIILEAWQQIPIRFPSVMLDVFVVMPNHVHGVLVLDAPLEEPEREGADKQEGAAHSEGAASSAPTIGQVIRAFKSIAAVSANRLLGRTEWPLWQRSYHDKVIRNEKTLEKVRQYVVDNPLRWDLDADNPVNL